MSTKSACWLGFHISSQKIAPSTSFDHKRNIRRILEEAQETGIALDPTPEESFSREEAAAFATNWQEQSYDNLYRRDILCNDDSAFMIGIHAGQIFVNSADSFITGEDMPFPNESKTEALRLLNEIIQLCLMMEFRTSIRKDVETTKSKFAQSKTQKDAMGATGYLGAWLIKAF